MSKPILPSTGGDVPLSGFVRGVADFTAKPGPERQRLFGLALQAGYLVTQKQVDSAYSSVKGHTNWSPHPQEATPTPGLHLPSQAFMSAFGIVNLSRANLLRLHEKVLDAREFLASVLDEIEEYLDDRLPEIEALLRENEQLRLLVQELRAAAPRKS